MANALANPAANTAVAEQPAAADADVPPLAVRIVYLTKKYREPPPLSLVDKVLTDEGVQGARVALKENNMTGRLLNHSYVLKEAVLPENADVVAPFKAMIDAGQRLFLADLEQKGLLAIGDVVEGRDAIILNIWSSDDELRGENCRSNLFLITPSYAMRADALAQYLLWKKWRR